MTTPYNLQVGKLRHKIDIQRKVVTRDAHGGEIVSFNTIAQRWGSIRPATGREVSSADQIDAIISHEIKMRFFSGLLATDRLSFRSKIYNMISVRDIDERKKIHMISALQDTSVIILCIGTEENACILQENGAEILLEP